MGSEWPRPSAPCHTDLLRVPSLNPGVFFLHLPLPLWPQRLSRAACSPYLPPDPTVTPWQHLPHSSLGLAHRPRVTPMVDSLHGCQGGCVGWGKPHALRGGRYRGLKVPPLPIGSSVPGPGPSHGGYPQPAPGRWGCHGPGQHRGGLGQARGSLRSRCWAGGPGLHAAHARCQGAAGPRAVGNQEQPGPSQWPQPGSRAGL